MWSFFGYRDFASFFQLCLLGCYFKPFLKHTLSYFLSTKDVIGNKAYFHEMCTMPLIPTGVTRDLML